MVSGVRIDMGVAHVRAGPDHERRTELRDPLPALLDAKPVAMGSARPLDATGIEEERGEVHLLHRGGLGRGGDVVNKNGERNLLVGDEGLGVSHVAGPNGHHFGTGSGDFGVSAPQLRGVLSAEQSAEVAQKDQDHRAVGPEVTQAMALPVGSGQLDVLQPL